MQKLMRKAKGSALVGVVAFSLVMSIGALGYLQMSGVSASNELATLDDAHAFLAAESGLLMGTRWFRAQHPTMPTFPATVTMTKDTINGFRVDVTLTSAGGVITVTAKAVNTQKLPYEKSVSWDFQSPSGPFLGTFINTMTQAVGGGGGGGGGFNNMWFDGPFHMNRSIILSSVSNPGADGAGVKFVNGAVSVFNNTDATSKFDKNDPFNTGDFAGYGDGIVNNYDFGIFKHSLAIETEQGNDLDAHFEQIFMHSQDERMLVEQSWSVVETLQVSLPDAGNPEKRGTLQFNADGSATYKYWDGSAFQTQTIADVDGRLVYSQNDLNVYGKVDGKVTVKTGTGLDIYVTGELTYVGFDPLADPVDADYENYDNTNNYGIDMSNTSTIALFANKDVVFPYEWYDPFTGSVTDVVGNVNGELYVTASVIAKTGSHAWTSDKKNDYQYDRMRLVGSRTLDDWNAPYFSGGVSSNDMVRFYYDKRLSTGLSAPGVPLIVVSDGGVTLFEVAPYGWRETNVKP